MGCEVRTWRPAEVCNCRSQICARKSPANASHAGGSGLKAKRQSGDGRHDTKLAVILRLQIDLHCVSFWIATAISAAFRLIHIIAKLMLWIARAA